jgi:hypothetical protein
MPELAADGIAVSEPPSSDDRPVVEHPSTEPGRLDGKQEEVVADCPPRIEGGSAEPASPEPDFLAAAQLCTELGRVENASDVPPLLQEAARILDAIGLIVWVWDAMAEELKPALAHGYSDQVLAQLPTVKRDADNATAAAFRSAQTCAIDGSDHANGALVVPLLTPAGCAGVLAIELQQGSGQTRSLRAVATIFAAQLAQLIGNPPAEVRPAAEIRPPAEVTTPPVANFTTRVRRVRARR